MNNYVTRSYEVDTKSIQGRRFIRKCFETNRINKRCNKALNRFRRKHRYDTFNQYFSEKLQEN